MANCPKRPQVLTTTENEPTHHSRPMFFEMYVKTLLFKEISMKISLHSKLGDKFFKGESDLGVYIKKYALFKFSFTKCCDIIIFRISFAIRHNITFV